MKRTLTIILSIIMASSFVCGLPVYAKESTNKSAYIIGDTDLDNVVTIKDATLLQFYIAKLAKLTDKQLLLADVDHDNVNTIKDTTCIQLYLSHKLTNTDIGTPFKINTDNTQPVTTEPTEKPTKTTYDFDVDYYYSTITDYAKSKGFNIDTNLTLDNAAWRNPDVLLGEWVKNTSFDCTDYFIKQGYTWIDGFKEWLISYGFDFNYEVDINIIIHQLHEGVYYQELGRKATAQEDGGYSITIPYC